MIKKAETDAPESEATQVVTTPAQSDNTPSHPPRILCYRDGNLRQDLPFKDVDGEIADKRGLVWIDLDNPSEDHLQHLAEELSLHPLAMLDIKTPHQRPKIDEYGDLTLVVLFAAETEPPHRIRLRQVAMYVGPGYLVTIHQGPVPALEDVRKRWQTTPDFVEPSPPGFLLYRICAALLDGYFPIVDTFDRRIEKIEDRLFRRLGSDLLHEMLLIRRDLVELRRVAGPPRDVFTALSRHEGSVIGQAAAAYFSDLVDLSLRLTETIDTMRDRLSTALDSYLTLQSNALNETMKRLTSLTVILTVPMIISGIYGMNFEVIPELHWTTGYPMALGLMVVLAVAAYWVFKRKNWL